MATTVKLKHILQKVLNERFPAGIEASFAYGSAVFEQKGDISFESNTVDMVLVVDNLKKFHEMNMKLNPQDYSIMKYFGSQVTSILGNNFSAGIIYYPFVKYNGMMLKYGVISKSKLLEDLISWNYLYVAGRLQKPVLWLKNCKRVDLALNHNLSNALSVSLLNQPKKFTEDILYKDLCKISYDGDIRTFFGVDKNKHTRIVDNNIKGFRNLYDPVLSKLSSFVRYDKGSGLFYKDDHIDSFLIRKLPYNLMLSVKQSLGVTKLKQVMRLERKLVNEAIRSRLKRTVLASSFGQTTKGFLTTSFSKSFFYAKEKIMKSFRFRNF